MPWDERLFVWLFYISIGVLLAGAFATSVVFVWSGLEHSWFGGAVALLIVGVAWLALTVAVLRNVYGYRTDEEQEDNFEDDGDYAGEQGQGAN